MRGNKEYDILKKLDPDKAKALRTKQIVTALLAPLFALFTGWIIITFL